jgi:hypothetical protein
LAVGCTAPCEQSQGVFVYKGNLDMALREQINEDMKAAMKAGEKDRLATVRLLLAEVRKKEVDERITLDPAQVIAVVEKMIKQRKDAIGQFEAAKRQDLAEKEKAEVAVLMAYLPQQLSEAEVAAIVDAAVAESGAKTPAEMGKVMGLVKPRVAGRADMGKVSVLIKAKLAG